MTYKEASEQFVAALNVLMNGTLITPDCDHVTLEQIDCYTETAPCGDRRHVFTLHFSIPERVLAAGRTSTPPHYDFEADAVEEPPQLPAQPRQLPP